MLAAELKNYGGEEGFKVAMRMERVKYNLDNRPEHDQIAAKRSFKENIKVNEITTKLKCEKEVQVCFKEKKHFSRDGTVTVT